MRYYQETGVLGPRLPGFREIVLALPFGTESPSGSDNGYRPGSREAAIVCDWEGCELFFDAVRATVLQHAQMIQPELPSHARPHRMQVVKNIAGGFFGKHTDAEYPDMPGRKVGFVYYLGCRDTFTGGELTFAGGSVEPMDDSLVVLDGSEPHWVTPVVGTDALRLTIAGHFAPAAHYLTFAD